MAPSLNTVIKTAAIETGHDPVAYPRYYIHAFGTTQDQMAAPIFIPASWPGLPPRLLPAPTYAHLPSYLRTISPSRSPHALVLPTSYRPGNGLPTVTQPNVTDDLQHRTAWAINHAPDLGAMAIVFVFRKLPCQFTRLTQLLSGWHSRSPTHVWFSTQRLEFSLRDNDAIGCNHPLYPQRARDLAGCPSQPAPATA